MGIFDRFKSKKEDEEKSAEKKEKPKVARGPARQIKVEKKKAKSKTEKPKKPARIATRSVAGGETKTRKVAKKEENLAYRALLEPLVSEKSTGLGQFNKYVFKVHSKASKFQVKSAVEDYYGVGVTKVNIIKIRPKKRIHGRTVGWKQGFKKAVVTLAAGDTIGVTEGV